MVGVIAAGATSSSLAWSAPQVLDKHALLAIRCPTTTLCVAIDSAGNVLSTRTPSAGAKGWKISRLDKDLSALACPSASLCVAVDSTGHVLSTRKPGGGAKTWTKSLVDTIVPRELSAVACRSNLCIVGGVQANAWASTNPTGPGRGWKLLALPSNGDSGGSMSGFSCPLKSLCIGVDMSTGEGFIDDVYTSTGPTNPNRWHLTAEFNNNSFNGVACPTKSLCVAPTDGGEVITSTDPTRASSWRETILNSNRSIQTVACPLASFCVLGDDAGSVETSTNPAGGAGAWLSHSVAPKDSIESIACPSARLCIAVTHKGRVIVGTG